jgi:hypothetical protein
MARHHIENPPEHQDPAPQGEIRQEPLPTIRAFSLFIAAAFALPAIGMAAMGFEMGRTWVGVGGLILLLGLGTLYYVLLYGVMRTRKIDPSEH